VKRALLFALGLSFVTAACSSDPEHGRDENSAPATTDAAGAAQDHSTHAADATARDHGGDASADHGSHTAADHAAHVAAGTHDGHTDADHAAHVAAATTHAGQRTAPAQRPAAAADPHAGHVMPPATRAADPHAGHAPTPAPRPAATDPHAAHTAPAAHDAHAAHGAQTAHDHGVELPATPGQGFTVADVRFMQMMMAHHAQAVVMSAMASTHGAGELVLKLAEKIDISQRDEIEMMRQWLRERGQAVPTDSQMLVMQMPGMLTPAEMKQLSETRGIEFDILFLRLMIRHHDGAIDMVDELFASPGAAQDPDIFRFVTDVAADQGDEIFVMQRMLDMITAGLTTETR
jgi:uncharacterized protein (DUF305 family)